MERILYHHDLSVMDSRLFACKDFYFNLFRQAGYIYWVGLYYTIEKFNASVDLRELSVTPVGSYLKITPVAGCEL
jgi:hypothetical protein